MVESLSKNVTRQGMTSTTLNYLRVRMEWSLTLSCFSPMNDNTDVQTFYSFCSCVSSWSRCRSWCRGTRRTRSTPGTASKPRSSRSGRRWSRRQVKKDWQTERQTSTELGNTADIGPLCMRPRYMERTTQVLPSGLKRCLQVDTTLRRLNILNLFCRVTLQICNAMPDLYCDCLAASIIDWVLYNVSLNVWV